MRRGFSLVELMVVIAIISVLAALFQPTFVQAVENSRRSVCSNNPRQLLLGLMNYAGDFGGKVPPPYSSWQFRNCTRVNAGTGIVTPYRHPTIPGAYIFYPPLMFLIDMNYTPKPLYVCPSMDYDCTISPQDHMHYEYRGNSSIEIYSGDMRVFSRPGIGQYALFWDHASDKTYSIIDPTYRRESKIDGSIFFGLTTNYTRLKWAHEDGGNICRYDGSVKWLDNHPHTSTNNTSRIFGSWPAYRYDTGRKIIASFNEGTTKCGIDVWINEYPIVDGDSLYKCLCIRSFA